MLEGPEIKVGHCHLTTGKPSLSTQQLMDTFFKLGKGKAVKGKGSAPPIICSAQDTVGL